MSGALFGRNPEWDMPQGKSETKIGPKDFHEEKNQIIELEILKSE